MVYKVELIRRVWEKVNVGKEKRKERLKHDDVEMIINTFLKELSQCMIDGEDIHMRGFGRFISKMRSGRTVYNTLCKKEIVLPERRVIKFDIAQDVDKIIKEERKNKENC